MCRPVAPGGGGGASGRAEARSSPGDARPRATASRRVRTEYGGVVEATARLTSRCAACQGESSLEVRQYIQGGRLGWTETFACPCGHGFEARDVGLPSPAARRALLEQHGAAELWLDAAPRGEAAVKVLVLCLQVTAARAAKQLEGLPAKVYEGTRVEAEFVFQALGRVSAEARVVPRLPTAPRTRSRGVFAVTSARPPEKLVHVTKANAASVMRQAIKAFKADAEHGAALAQRVFEVAKRAGTFPRLHASFEVLAHMLARRRLSLDFALDVVRELLALQRDRTHLALLADVYRAMGRTADAERAADEAKEALEEHAEVQRDFLKTCAALGVDPTQ